MLRQQALCTIAKGTAATSHVASNFSGCLSLADTGPRAASASVLANSLAPDTPLESALCRLMERVGATVEVLQSVAKDDRAKAKEAAA